MKTIMIIFLSVALVGNFAGRSKSPENLLAPELLLTFDTRNMLNWEKHIPLFEKDNAYLTFFIDYFDELTSDLWKALQKLKDAGHAIGCHGLRHLQAVNYCEKYSVEKYIPSEIVPAIKIMEEKRFPPVCFVVIAEGSEDIYQEHPTTVLLADGKTMYCV